MLEPGQRRHKNKIKDIQYNIHMLSKRGHHFIVLSTAIKRQDDGRQNAKKNDCTTIRLILHSRLSQWVESADPGES